MGSDEKGEGGEGGLEGGMGPEASQEGAREVSDVPRIIPGWKEVGWVSRCSLNVMW